MANVESGRGVNRDYQTTQARLQIAKIFGPPCAQFKSATHMIEYLNESKLMPLSNYNDE
jgi:hypothetical protein